MGRDVLEVMLRGSMYTMGESSQSTAILLLSHFNRLSIIRCVPGPEVVDGSSRRE